MKTVGEIRAALAAFDDDTLLVVPGFDEWGFDHPSDVTMIKVGRYVGGATIHAPAYEASGDKSASETEIFDVVAIL